MEKALETKKFIKVGNNLSLDFINSKIAENGQPKDLLADFADFTAWAAAMNLLEKSQVEKLLDDWNGCADAEAAFARAINFRGILHEMFVRISSGKAIGNQAIAAINREIQNQSGAIEIKKTENGFEKLFRADFREPHQLLAPVAESAADLLCYGDLTLVKKCENPECVLYFYDSTKNHTRCWCSMAACGNRAKAAAFYERKRTEKGKTNSN